MSESGLVFENSAEDMSVETEIAYRVAKALKPTAIFCTGTSRLIHHYIDRVLFGESAQPFLAYTCLILLTTYHCVNSHLAL